MAIRASVLTSAVLAAAVSGDASADQSNHATAAE